jgi:hypothetical protein
VDVNPDFNILQSLYHLVEPTCVLVSSQVPETFISVLKSLTGADSPSGHSTSRENVQPEKKLNILSRKDYSKLLVPAYFLNLLLLLFWVWKWPVFYIFQMNIQPSSSGSK